MILLISYDLNGHERPSAYEAVRQVIVDLAVSFKQPLYSQWFVETAESANAWSDRIGDVADTNDSWFVCQVTSERQGWLDESIWSWLRERA